MNPEDDVIAKIDAIIDWQMEGGEDATNKRAKQAYSKFGDAADWGSCWDNELPRSSYTLADIEEMRSRWSSTRRDINFSTWHNLGYVDGNGVVMAGEWDAGGGGIPDGPVVRFWDENLCEIPLPAQQFPWLPVVSVYVMPYVPDDHAVDPLEVAQAAIESVLDSIMGITGLSMEEVNGMQRLLSSWDYDQAASALSRAEVCEPSSAEATADEGEGA